MLFALTAFGQEKAGEDKNSSSRLTIAGDIRLSRDIARDIERLDEMEKAGNWEMLIGFYKELLEETSGKLVQNSDKVFVSAGDFLRERMSKLGPQAREIYRIQFDRAALRAYKAATLKISEKQLEAVVRNYSLSSYSDDAMSLLAAIDAERGDFVRAAEWLRKLLSWYPDTDLDVDMIRIRAAWYNYYSGRFARVKRYLKELGVDDAAKVEDAAKYRLSVLADIVRKNKFSTAAGEVRERAYIKGIPGGGLERAGVSGEVVRCEKIAWQGYLFGSRNARKALRRSSIENSKRQRMLSPGSNDFRYQSVEYDGKVYTGTEVGVNVTDLRTGRLLMELLPPGGGDYFPETDSYISPTVTEDCVYANFVYEVSASENFQGILIKAAMPRYTLCAYDRRSGKLKWAAHRSAKLKKQFAGKWFSMPSAPVLVGDMLITEVRTRGMLAGTYLAAFDSETGEPRWIKPLCSNGRELTMFGYEARGPLSTMLASSDGGRPTVYCCTNLGAVFAVDGVTGEVRWAAEYDQIQLRAAEMYRAQMRNFVWINTPPLIAAGVLVAAPLDSQYVHAFNAQTGKMLWRYNYSWQSAQFRNVLGVVDGKVIIDGTRLAAIELGTGKVKWITERRGVRPGAGRGLLTQTQVVVPRSDGMYRYSISSGKLIRSQRWPTAGARGEPGNLLVTGDQLVVTGTTRITAYGSLTEK
jgi:outer membrane protein assembly factor BamB/tetratricopeptide (TPR) repeat protein